VRSQLRVAGVWGCAGNVSATRYGCRMDDESQPSASGGAVTGDDGLARTPWAYGDPMLLDYYDSEWGLPVHDEAGLFERMSLEGFQAGLSWLTILKKRERFREVFAGFDPDAVARFGEGRDRTAADRFRDHPPSRQDRSLHQQCRARDRTA
jgi:DNA-3-methyladenine glycosylase I